LTLGDVVAKVSSIDRNGKGYADVPDAPDFPNRQGFLLFQVRRGSTVTWAELLPAPDRKRRSKRLAELEKCQARWDRGRIPSRAPIPMLLARVGVLWREFAVLRAIWYARGGKLGDPALPPS
jgi:hypothetical protein